MTRILISIITAGLYEKLGMSLEIEYEKINE
jgi:hypothetical protein